MVSLSVGGMKASVSMTLAEVVSGRKIRLRYAASTCPHHVQPPHNKIPSPRPPTAITTRAKRRRPRSGAMPGSSTLSRTAAPKTVIAPTNRKTAAPTSPVAMTGPMSRRRSAIARTGTKAPLPPRRRRR